MSSNQNPRTNPRGGDRRGPRQFSGRPGLSWAYALGLLLLLGLAQMYYFVPAGKSITYSEFKEYVKNDAVSEVVVGEQNVRGTLKQAVPNGNRQTKEFTATRVEDPKLTEELEARGIKYSGESNNRWLPELLGWLVPLLFFVGIWGFFFRRMSGAEGGVMSFARSKAKVFADDEVKVRFADVAGVDEAREELREVVEFLKTPKKYTNLGGKIPKGVLLVGPPGTGKTLLARAVAGEAHVPFFSLSGSEFVEMFVGVGAARIRDLFQQAEAKAPCIVFIDELDALGKARVLSPVGSHEEREQTLNQLLAEMDGFDSRKGVIIMGATNRPEVLDPALLRPGRFDRQVLVDKPDVKGREEILRIHIKGVKIASDVDIKVVAARTAGFAGADLANLVNEAALLAARKDKTEVGPQEFEAAIERLVAGLERKRVMSDKDRETIAYHETGHAVVASVLEGQYPVHKISIVGRGFGVLGYTLHLPTEERYLSTRTQLQGELAVLLGGRTAEEITFGEITTGAQNDLLRATDIARSMVTEYGMSDELGLINYDGAKRPKFLDVGMPQERGLYSEETALKIDGEIKRIISDAHTRAHQILTDRREQVDVIAKRLLSVEVMEGDELRQILGLPPLPKAQQTFSEGKPEVRNTATE
ncbi:MAG: ATP-dependent zinc metalloprotease FtsH [Vicinamibacterales bacterium]